MTKREYSNGQIRVLWDSDACEHCKKCWHGLPAVFNPSLRPWINLQGAPTDQIRAQVLECPTGAILLGESDGTERTD